MILLAHMLFGAAIGVVIKNFYLAIFLALLGHYFLDLFPHLDYSVENLKNKAWRKSIFEIFKITVDIGSALLIIFLISENNLIIYICALVAIVPDSMTLISRIFPNKILSIHDYIHTNKIHFLKYKKISKFWRISTQVLAVLLSSFLLLL